MGDADANWKKRLEQLGLRGRLPDRLTQAVIDATTRKPLGERYDLPDGEVPGLVLRVGANGAGVFSLLFRNAAGIKCRFNVGAASVLSLETARRRAREELGKVARGVDPAAEKRAARATAIVTERSTVRAYLADVYGPQVLAHRKDGGVPKKPEDKPSGTYARICAAWKPLLDKPLPALTRGEIEKVLADRKGEGKAAGTLLRDWSAFRAMLADAVDRGVLAAIPMARRPEPIRRTQGNQRVRWLGKHDTEEQLAAKTDERARFLAALEKAGDVQACAGDFLRFACRLALATGLRRGEIVRLSQSMINARGRKLTLPAEITKSNRPRVVSLNDDALAALSAWPMRGTRGELCPGDPVVWADRITHQGWPALCEEGKIEDLHFHDLRHDFAVRLLRSGATLEQVRDALGHASITQTEKYAHVMPGDVHKAVLAMAKV